MMNLDLTGVTARLLQVEQWIAQHVQPWMGWTAGAAALVILLGFVWFFRRRSAEASRSLSHQTRWPRRLGYATVLLFFGGFGSWAAIASLASAAVAPGVVSPEGNRKTVQHLEGGIIERIHVREGDRVAVGDPVVTLQDTRARAALGEIRERYIHLLAKEARLMAEAAGDDAVAMPASLAAFGEAGANAIQAQRELFASRRATLAGQTRILAQRTAQLEEQIAGLERVIAAQNRQLALIEEEVGSVTQLLDKGLARKPRLLALQRAQAAIMAEKARNEATIAGNRQKIGETEYELITIRSQRREKIDTAMTDTRSDLAMLKSQLPSRQDQLSRTVISAPIAGTIMNVQVTTETGVVKPGAQLLDIVPEKAPLVIDARVAPTDIETIRPGQQARVLLTAYGQRSLPQVYGTLRSISADRLEDERNGQPYFLAKVEVDPAHLDALGGDLELSPGMPADVMILTGERTMLDYLVRPFVESFTKSFRES